MIKYYCDICKEEKDPSERIWSIATKYAPKGLQHACKRCYQKIQDEESRLRREEDEAMCRFIEGLAASHTATVIEKGA